MELFSEYILKVSPWRQRNQFIAENFLEPNKSLLDLGAGAKTFLWYYKPSKYFSVEGMPLEGIDLVIDLDTDFQDKIPGYYDYVLNSGILEFVKTPQKYLQRQLKLGDEFIFTYDRKIGLTTITYEQMDNLIREYYIIDRKEDFGKQRIYKCRPL
tara:strand:- start:159 stop:623 length:465 start_codon:yes stop_codon:yes gene_type:complete